MNSVVVTPKVDRSIRLCLDPRDLNKAVKRNAYYARTVDDVIPQVSGLTPFCIVDARRGYWQVLLDKESSRLCTFITHWGKFTWNRLPFGLTCSGDIFHEKMDTVFGQLHGLTGISDDTFVYGKGENNHDQHILKTLDTARENNAKFNPDKFQFKVEETSFFGLTWTSQGVKPDDKIVKCIVDMQPPFVSLLNTFVIYDQYVIAPAGFWPRGQNPRRHPRIPRVYTYKEFQNVRK